MSKAVKVYNDRKEYEMTFRSMSEAARSLDVDVSRISRASRTGQWVFATGIAVMVKKEN